ncbi:MAG: vanadium-dependent haloperoxidase [Gammaproteobacteria bacterium]
MKRIYTFSESATNRQPKAWPIGKRLGGAIVAALVLFGARAAHADAVTDWNAIMETTVLTQPDPFLQLRSAAITQVAVFEAVNAIAGDYEPYFGSVTAPPGASPEAAAIAAAHGALAALHPDSAAELDAMRATSLAAIPDGWAKDAGIAVGEAAALALLAERENDGSIDDTPYTPGTGPGQYRPTPLDFTPAFRPGLGQVKTFAIKSGAQFRIAPPPALGSRRYARDYNEVKKVGDLHSSERPPDRADVARFYAVTDTVLWYPLGRQVSQAQGKTLAENARTFALLGIAIFDATVAVFDSKYFYNYWRPVTAIHNGDRDGNRRTDPDANWATFVPTPPFPSYPSGHAGFSNAARRVLERMFGAEGHSITVANPVIPDVVLHYTSWKQITDDIDDARIYGGVHYRFDQETAARQGRRVGSYVLRHWLRPVHSSDSCASRENEDECNK